MGLQDIHHIFFNAGIMFSFVLGVWAAVLAARKESVSGNYWGAIVTFSGLMLFTLVLGIIMALQGLAPGPEENKRTTLYFLYMAFLVVIMPGLFSLMRGRDDRQAALAFSVLAFFNTSVMASMITRYIGEWT